jgi:hypothetical protein
VCAVSLIFGNTTWTYFALTGGYNRVFGGSGLISSEHPQRRIQAIRNQSLQGSNVVQPD